MQNVTIRPQRLSDAKRFFEILTNPHFVFFDATPASLAAERTWLAGNAKRRKKNLEHNFTILYRGALVGACGIKVDQHRPHIGEIGYFVEEAFWGKGIAPQAVALVEKFGRTKIGISRFVILINAQNTASRRVAAKSGYRKEGTLKRVIKNKRKYQDCVLYAKCVS